MLELEIFEHRIFYFKGSLGIKPETVIKIASMLNKIYMIALAVIYLITLAVLSLATIALTYYAYSWLGSKTNPSDVVSNYEYFSNRSWILLWISSLILLVLANVILWKTRQSWAFWTTLAYFVIFIIAQTFWLASSFLQYKKNNNLTQSEFSFSPFLGVGICVAAAGFVFFNQILVLRMRDRMFLSEQPIGDLPPTATSNDDEKAAE